MGICISTRHSIYNHLHSWFWRWHQSFDEMMTKPWMEFLSPTAAYFPDSNRLLDQTKSGCWTQQENKLFESALAYIDENSSDRWHKVAEMIPGKTVADVLAHYRNLVEDVSYIEAGLVPSDSYFMLDCESSQGLKQAYCTGGKRSAACPADHERKKGVPWTEDEHRLFLLGLKKYGKGDWRNISRQFVVTRTPTQVASHAQKYFIRISSDSKDKRRSSIHDITTLNLPDTSPSSPSQLSGVSMQSTSPVATRTSDHFSIVVDSNQQNEAVPLAHHNSYMQQTYGMDGYKMKSQPQQLHRSNLHNSIVGQQGLLFPMQKFQQHRHG